jgi:predicted RNase H-like HicB family nuclease
VNANERPAAVPQSKRLGENSICLTPYTLTPFRLAVAGWAVIESVRKAMPMTLRIVLEPSDEGGFTVWVPALPGCISEGDTRTEALVNIREAIELYLEPVDDDSVASPGAETVELAL